MDTAYLYIPSPHVLWSNFDYRCYGITPKDTLGEKYVRHHLTTCSYVYLVDPGDIIKKYHQGITRLT